MDFFKKKERTPKIELGHVNELAEQIKRKVQAMIQSIPAYEAALNTQGGGGGVDDLYQSMSIEVQIIDDFEALKNDLEKYCTIKEVSIEVACNELGIDLEQLKSLKILYEAAQKNNRPIVDNGNKRIN